MTTLSPISFVWDPKAHRLQLEIVEFGPYLERSSVLDGPRRPDGYRRLFMARFYPESLREEDAREADELEEDFQRYAESTPWPGLPYPARDWIEAARGRQERRYRIRMLREADGGRQIRLEIRRVRLSDRLSDGEHSEYSRMLWIVAP